MNKQYFYLFWHTPFKLIVYFNGDGDVLDALAREIATEVLVHLSPQSGKTIFDLSDDNLELGYHVRLIGFFPHERVGLERQGVLEGFARRFGSPRGLTFSVMVKELPSVPPATDEEGCLLGLN